MEPKLGASLLSWIPPLWTPEGGLFAIQQTARAGFDLLEILLPSNMEFDANAVKRQLQSYNLDVVCSFNLPKEAHIPFYPKEAVRLIKLALEKTALLDTDFLGGVLHSGIGVFSGAQRTEEEENILCDVWREVADYALRLGITIGIEPINRYESYVCTSAAEVLFFINKVNASNLVLHLDTFHMNIEESDFYNPVINAGNKLHHLHMTESDRGMLGEGNVHWDDLFLALSQINFKGNLVLENFTNQIPGMAESVSLWRPSKYDAFELAKGSLEFMQKMVQKYQGH